MTATVSKRAKERMLATLGETKFGTTEGGKTYLKFDAIEVETRHTGTHVKFTLGGKLLCTELVEGRMPDGFSLRISDIEGRVEVSIA